MCLGSECSMNFFTPVNDLRSQCVNTWWRIYDVIFTHYACKSFLPPLFLLLLLLLQCKNRELKHPRQVQHRCSWFTGTVWNVWFRHLLIVSIVGKEITSPALGRPTWNKSAKRCKHLCSQNSLMWLLWTSVVIIWNSFTWLHLTARKVGKCSPAMDLMFKPSVSVSWTNVLPKSFSMYHRNN